MKCVKCGSNTKKHYLCEKCSSFSDNQMLFVFPPIINVTELEEPIKRQKDNVDETALHNDIYQNNEVNVNAIDSVSSNKEMKDHIVTETKVIEGSANDIVNSFANQSFNSDPQLNSRPRWQFKIPYRVSKATICAILSIGIEVALLIIAFSTDMVKVAMETSLGSYLAYQIVLMLNALVVCVICRIGGIRIPGYVAVAISIAATWYSFYKQVFDGNGPTETGFLESAFVSVTAFLLFGAASLGVSAACAGITKIMRD